MSFINPLFLIAGSVALLPLIYHLIRKMRARRVPFSSLLFLKATPKELIKRRKLENLILLIIRCAILGLLACAFARPFFPEQKIPFIEQAQNKSTVLLLDNSYSMQYGDLFDRARQEALKRINSAGIDDEVALVIFSDKAEQLSELSHDIQLPSTILEKMQVSHRATDFYKPLKLAEDILKNARHEKKEIILLSDLQSNGWSRQFENWKISPHINIIPVRITGQDDENAYIKKFDIKHKRTGKSIATQYGLEIESDGNNRNKSGDVSLWLNGKKIDSQKYEVKEVHQLYFQQRALKQGNYQGYSMLAKDKLLIDNIHYFSLNVGPQLSIFCIDGSSRSSRSNSFYLKNCFNLGEKSLYRFSSGNKTLLNSGKIKNHNILFLTNINYLTNQQLTHIKTYVMDGGNLVISFGNRINLKKYSLNLESLGIGQILDKVRIRDIKASHAVIAEVDLKHPIFSLFNQTGSGDILRPKFREYVKMVPDSTAQVLGRYDTGDPFLIEKQYGNGKFFVLTSSLNTDWGDFPVNEIYLPFLYQIAKYATSSESIKNSFLIGDVVVLYGNPGEQWEINTPENKIYKVPVDENGVGYFRETEIPGNYRAVRSDEDYLFSVNVDVNESDLNYHDAEEFYTAVTQPLSKIQDNMNRAGFENIKDAENKQKMWRYIIIFVVLLLIFETYYANKKTGQRSEGYKEVN